MAKFHYVDTAGKWPRRFSVVRRSERRAGKRSVLGFEYTTLSRHFTHRAAYRRAKALNNGWM